MLDQEKLAALGKKPRRKGKRTIDEKKEIDRERQAAKRQQKAQEEGRELKSRRSFATELLRKEARAENVAKAKEAHKERNPKEPWAPQFIGIDGESFQTGELLPDGTPKQAYCLLLRHDKQPIFNREGLSTWDCLNYLTKSPPRKTALVGYFLNFDFEWILKDIEQDEYKKLQHGQMVSIFGDEYRLQWFVGKSLEVYKVYPSARGKKPSERKLNKDFRMIKFQDVSGFFQSSFVSALKKWGFAEDERLKIIIDGKAERGGFTFDKLKEVSRYNAMEMELLEELMVKVYDSFKAAYQTAGLKFNVHAGKWSGAGVFANDFLGQTQFAEEHKRPIYEQVQEFSERFAESFGNEAAKQYPFSLSYFGGRIELAAVGKFGSTWNYDINSAYPYATSLLPKWEPEDFLFIDYVGRLDEPEAKEILDRRLMGMYGVRFDFPPGWTWYPFPVRTVTGGSPNVFYPRQGTTHIMSPELFAVLDTLSAEEVQYLEITYAYVLKDTDGYGDALTRMEKERLCTTAVKTLEMADFRLECKAAGKRVEKGTSSDIERDKILAMAEKALKLILNSLYGKTVQQVGAHKYYNDFASAWITSTCRALLWRAISQEKTTHNVLMTMTDGVYSLVPLSFAGERISKILGEWEEETFTYMETFKPGIYRYTEKGEMHYKVRGFLAPNTEDKENLFSIIWDAVSRGTIGSFPSRAFLTRNLALHGWKREPYLRQFYEDKKTIESELKAKRQANDGTRWLIPEGAEHVFFKPKRDLDINESMGYALNFDGASELAEGDWEKYLLELDSKVGLEEFY